MHLLGWARTFFGSEQRCLFRCLYFFGMHHSLRVDLGYFRYMFSFILTLAVSELPALMSWYAYRTAFGK